MTEKQWLTIIRDAAERWNAESRGPALVFRGTIGASKYSEHCRSASQPSVFITYNQGCYQGSCNSNVIGFAHSGALKGNVCKGTGSSITILGKTKSGYIDYRLTADQNRGTWLLPLLIHEFGHVLGLGHPDQNPKDSGKYKEDMLGHSVMNSYILSGKDGAHLWPFEKSCVPQRWGIREAYPASSLPNDIPLFYTPEAHKINHSSIPTTKGSMMGHMGHIPDEPDEADAFSILYKRLSSSTHKPKPITALSFNQNYFYKFSDYLSPRTTIHTYKRLRLFNPWIRDFSYLYLLQGGESDDRYYTTSKNTVIQSKNKQLNVYNPKSEGLVWNSQLNINPTFTISPQGHKGFHYFPRSRGKHEYTPGIYARYFTLNDDRSYSVSEFQNSVKITLQNGTKEYLYSHVPITATFDPESNRVLYASVETDNTSANHGKIRIFYNPETSPNSQNEQNPSLFWGKFQYVAENYPSYKKELPRGTLFKPTFKTDLGIGMVCLDKKNRGISGDKNCFVAWVDRGLGTGQILFTTFSVNTSKNRIEWSNEVYPIPGAYSSNHVSLGLYYNQPILSYKTQDPYAHVGLRLYRGSLINSSGIWDILRVDDMPYNTHIVDPPTVAFAHQNSSNNTTEEKMVLMWSQVEIY